MIIGSRLFHVARMRPDRGDNAEIVISTAKEGLFKGLSTTIRNSVPTNAMIAKIIYMPAMNRKAIHHTHDMLVDLIENNLKKMCPLEVAIVDGLGWIKSTGCTLQIVVADWFMKAITENLASYKGQTVTQIITQDQYDVRALLRRWLDDNVVNPWPYVRDKEWGSKLEGVDFISARNEIARSFAIIESEAKEQNVGLLIKNDFNDAVGPFMSNPCLETAINLLKFAPPLYEVFEGSKPGGVYWNDTTSMGKPQMQDIRKKRANELKEWVREDKNI